MYEFLKQRILNDSVSIGYESPIKFFSYHFDNRKLFLTSDAKVLSFIGDELWKKISYLKPEVLYTKGMAGLSLMLSIKNSASKDNINLKCLFIRDERKKYSLKKIVEGETPDKLQYKRAIFIDDLFNKGTTFEHTKKILILEDYNLNIVAACVLIDFWTLEGSRKYNTSGFPIITLFKRHDFGLSRVDHNLKQIVKSLNWRTNEFHNGQNVFEWKSAPIIHKNTIIIGNDNNHHYCFDKDNGNLKWINYSKNPQPKGDVSVTQIHEDKAYWSSYDGTVKCCNVKNGNTIWSVKVDVNLHSSPTLDSKNNRLFLGTEYNKYPIKIGGFGEGDIVCLRMSDGQEIWRFKTGGMIPCCIGYSDKNNTIVTGSNDFHIYVLNADTGNLIKRIPTRGEVKGKIVITNDGLKAIGCSIQGLSYCICTKTGDVLWSKKIGNKNGHPYPLIFDNFAVFTNDVGMISCVDIDTGEFVWLSQCRHNLGWGLIDINENTLLGITEKGQLLTFDKKTGKKISNDNLSEIVNEKIKVISPSCFDGKNLFVVTNNFGIFSFKINP